MPQSKIPSFETLKALEAAPAMFLVLSVDFYILTASDLFLQATNSNRENIIGKYIFDAFSDNPSIKVADGENNILASLKYVVAHGKTHLMSVQRYDIVDSNHPDKFIVRYWEPTHTPIFTEDGELFYIIQSVNNVTEQILSRLDAEQSRDDNQANLQQVDALNKNLASAHDELIALNISLESDVINRTEELLASERKYRNVIEHSPVAMQVFRGKDMTFEIVNDAMLQFLGKTSDIIGKSLFEGVPEIVGQPIVEALYGVYNTGKPLEIYAEKVDLVRDGVKTVGYYDVIYRALYDHDQVAGVLGIAIDVTPQVLARQTIVESEARFRNMAEKSDILISLIDDKGQLEYLNNAWYILTGWSDSNLQTFNWENYLHPDDHADIMQRFFKVFEKQQDFVNEFRLLDSDGNYRWIRLRGTTRFNTEGDFIGYICSGIDITDEKQHFLEIEYINKALVHANDQLVNANLRLIDSEERLLTAFDAGELGSCTLDLKTGKADMSVRYRKQYGLPLEDDISWEMVLEAVEPEFLDEVNTVLHHAIEFGTPVDSTYAIKHLITGERRWMRVVGKVYQDEEGINERVNAVVMDVTGQKEDEQRKNDFIAMVSHELKTPLTSIKGYIQLLQHKTKNIAAFDGHSFVDKIQIQVKKMNTMINGFLNISRLESGKIQLNKSNFDLCALANDLKNEYEALITTHQIVYSPCSEFWVHADEDKISLVINNLLSNAVKYSPTNSKIYLQCEKVNQQVVLSVRDAGTGISSDDIPKLFDRYYRVQNEKTNIISGFGIGLYLSAEIIERHGGKIWVESELGTGSTFYFSI
ncbi:MAG: PAS domain S-box protein [Sphingobacteriales bacterium]|nr:MAG: PAS domain S-box protein [Sphingobacteriales bacterium]